LAALDAAAFARVTSVAQSAINWHRFEEVTATISSLDL
jgi:hypothetical protein